jgi:ketosteroid isomerase-like protein
LTQQLLFLISVKIYTQVSVNQSSAALGSDQTRRQKNKRRESIQLNRGGIQMSEKNKAILNEANAAIEKGDNEGFLSFCSDDTEWSFVGDQTLKGKEAVRRWMATEYVNPPENRVAHLIAEGDFVTALGDLTVKDKDGKAAHYSYCDVWRFRVGKMVELRAFVIKIEVE